MKNLPILRAFKKMRLTGFVLFSLLIILAFSSNPPNGKTGAPGDGACSESGCHTGSGSGLDGDISITGLPSSIIANNTYTITVTLDNPNAAANRAGFQWVVLDAVNQNAGTLSNPSSVTGQNSTIQSQAGRSYHEHSGSTNFPASNVISWTADWTAPAGPNGDAITIYGVGNIANGSGSSGDRIVFTNVNGTLSASVVAPTATISSSTDVTCNGGSDGSATVIASGGSPGYTFLWDNGETSATAVALNAGPHTVTVTDNASATGTASVTINEPTAIILTEISHQDISCFGLNDGSSTVTASGGIGSFSYAWSEGTVGQTASNLPPGSYTVTATDNNNCSAILPISIVEPSELDYEVLLSTPVSCFNGNDGSIEGEATGGTGPYSYLWSNGSTDNFISMLTAGDYIVTVTDNNNCQHVESVTISEPSQLNISVSSQSDETCNNFSDGTASVIASGGTPNYNYSWSTGATGPDQTGLPAGTYFVTATDDNNCTASTTVMIADGFIVVPTITNFTSPTCSNSSDGAMTASASGGTSYTYLWSTGATGANITGLTAGSYALTVTDISGCSAMINTGLVGPPAIAINTIDQSNVSCNNANDGFISIASTGGVGSVTYTWSNGQTGSTISNLPASTYQVTATDDNGCTSTSLFAISQPAILSAIVDTQANITCFGGADGTATIAATGGTSPYTYEWPSGNSTDTDSNLTAGIYSVLITDSNDCQTIVSVQITEPNILLANSTSTSESAAGANDGTATVAPSGGTSPYMYLWSNGATDPQITDLIPGTYSVTITDANNCMVTSTVGVSSGDCALTATTTSNDATCYELSNGNITLAVANATGTTNINWSNGALDTNYIDNLASGLYSVTVTDAALCEVILSDIFVARPDSLIVAADIISSPACAQDSTGAMSYTTMGGTAPYQILWSSSETTDTITDKPVGMYAITVTDANGCSANTSFVLNQLDTISPELLVGDFVLYIDDMGNIPSYDETNFDLGSSDNCTLAGYNFTEINTICDSIGSFNIDISLFDVNGNVAMDSVNLMILDTLAPIVTCPSDITVTTCSEVSYFIPTALDNCGAVSSVLVEGLDSGSDFPIGNTTITYAFTDIHDNTTMCSFVITVESSLAVEALTTDPGCFNFSNGSLILNIVGDNGPFEVDYIGGYNPEFMNAGDYAYSVTDSVGCTILDSIELFNPDILVISDAELINPETTSSLDGQINIDVVGGVAPYTFSWLLDGVAISTDEDLNAVGPGIYTVVITDENGCTYTSLPYELVSVVSTNDTELNNAISVFPNPASDIINVQLSDGISTPDKVEIYNTQGQLVRSIRKSTFQNTIDVSQLSNGLYLVKIVIGNKTSVKKLSIFR